jgi:SAM-dependent methyltransferase
MVSERFLSLVRCPDDRGALQAQGATLACGTCGRTYGRGDGYLDLRPHAAFDETTKYVDEALHADARHESVSPPLLSAAIRNDMLRGFLRPGREDRVVDLGCGSGRTLVWNRDWEAYLAGVDVSPFFAGEARRDVDLALADLRRLPFADGSFTAAYTLDVLEHLSRGSLEEVLGEAARVLRPGGALFVYTHVRKNSRIALGLRAINRLAAGLERMGLIDLTHEHLRKSDHLNPLADLDDLERVAAAAGFRIARIRYYTPLVGAFVENILLRLVERAMARRASPRAGGGGPAGIGEGIKAARAEAKRRIARQGPLYAALRATTWMMKLDVALFGRLPSGPFFALLIKDGAAGPRA